VSAAIPSGINDLQHWSARNHALLLVSKKYRTGDATMMKNTDTVEEREMSPDNSTLYVGLGLGLGGYATATSILEGFVYPACVVAAPALLAAGVYQKIGSRNRKPEDGSRLQSEAR